MSSLIDVYCSLNRVHRVGVEESCGLYSYFNQAAIVFNIMVLCCIVAFSC